MLDSFYLLMYLLSFHYFVFLILQMYYIENFIKLIWAWDDSKEMNLES